MAFAVGLLLLASSRAFGQEIQRGAYTAAFKEKSPLSSASEYSKRTGMPEIDVRKSDPNGGEYDLSKESFEVYVPASYSPEIPMGLLVFTNSIETGALPPEWKGVLDRYGLLWIGANNSGNGRKAWYRTNLALDAAHNMRKRYALDPDRVYVSGPSGGGRNASQTALCYPDVFAGGFFLIGCDYFRDVDTVGGGGVFRPEFAPPSPALLERAKTKNRYAIFTGENDHMRSPCLSKYQNGFKADRFAYITYLEARNWGHTNPDAEWFEKGIVALDSPLVGASPSTYATAQKSEKAGKFREAADAYRKAAAHGRTQPFFEDCRTKVVALLPQVEALGRDALEKLRSGKPDALRIREFSREWVGYEAGRQAAELANAMGEEELKKLTAATGPALRTSLQKFIGAWEGFRVAEEAVKTLDQEAEKEFEALKGVTPDKTRHEKLLAFAKVWAPSPKARSAKEIVEKEARAILEELKNVFAQKERLAKLSSFAKTYEGTAAGAEAKLIVDDMLQKMKQGK